MKIYNTGLKPVVIGKTKEGFPLAIHPRKGIELPEALAKKLLKKNQSLADSSGYKEKKSAETPIKKEKVIK